MSAPKTEYELEREANIKRNHEKLVQLGLAPAARAECLSTPPALARKRVVREAEHAAERRCSPRLLELQQEEPRRSYRPARAASGQENDDFATPGASPAKKPKARRGRGSQPELSNEELRALGARFGSTEWLVEIEERFLRDPVASRSFFNAQSDANVQTVMRQLHKMASGDGIPHPRNKDAPPFLAGKALTVEHEVGALLLDADDWLDEWGRDLSNGWLLKHPLKKLLAFQQFLSDGHRNLAAHLE